MGALEIITLALTHPNEFRTLLQFWNYHDATRDITKKEEHATTGWDRPTMRRCWELLDHSSRSFSTVIKQLDGDLARIVSRFPLSLSAAFHLHPPTTQFSAISSPFAYVLSPTSLIPVVPSYPHNCR